MKVQESSDSHPTPSIQIGEPSHGLLHLSDSGQVNESNEVN